MKGRFLTHAPTTSGLNFENRFDWQNPRKHLYPHGYAGGGVAVGDFDQDGRPDLFFTSQTGRDRLFRQVADWRFTDVSDRLGHGDERDWGTGASFADVDGDGDLDLFVSNYDAANRLYINLGDGRFEDQAAARGVAFRGASIMAAFADYDLDGDLDMYLVTNRLYPPPEQDFPRFVRQGGKTKLAPGQEESFVEQVRRIGGEDQRFVANVGQRDYLYENLGDGHFREVASDVGITGNHPGLSATWWDADDDGDPDLYVCNDFWEPDRFYRNDDGRFQDIVKDALPHTPWFSMGSDFADVDGDGHFDFLAADMSARTHFMSKLMMGNMNDSRWFLTSANPRQYMRNALYLGTGGTRFLEAAWLSGLASTDWTWSVKFGDLDNDTDVDLYATNGTANQSFDPDLSRELGEIKARMMARRRPPEEIWRAQWEAYRRRPPRRERNVAMQNVGPLDFQSVGADWRLDQESISFGAVLSDLDRDGDLDIVSSNVQDPAGLFENQVATGNGLLVALKGRGANTRGIGARLKLKVGSQVLVRQMFQTRGYMSSNEAVVHFGLGAANRAERLIIEWPGGPRQVVENLAGGQFYVIEEAATSVKPERAATPVPAMLTQVDSAAGLGEGFAPERAFDDYKVQSLLPAGLSQLGPGLAVADVDGDELEDVYIGGPAGQAGRLFIAQPSGEFRFVAGPWQADAESEDMGVAFLDVDGDGDQDLFVASGSTEFGRDDPRLRDRLYLNTGKGFKSAPSRWLPKAQVASGPVAVVDFEGDGDLDIFVGARVRPNEYPHSGASRLLINDGRRFRDRTAALAPGLADAGLVSGARWSDVDKDGDSDLLLALEWGPIQLFLNQGKGLQQASHTGLESQLGWWNALEVADFDGDGDFDIVALNAGLNTKYAASPEKPQLLYYGDFEGNGAKRLVEAKSGASDQLPVRGLSCSSSAMPSIGTKVEGSYHRFASATLTDIYPQSTLDAAERYVCNQLAHGVFLQEPSQGRVPQFRFVELPRQAQISTGFGVVVEDFDFDTWPDLLIAHNFFHREPETGRWDGGLGALLRGGAAERSGFEVLGVKASGVEIDGDARAVARIDYQGGAVLVARNNLPPQLYLRAQQPRIPVLKVHLVGTRGNPTAIGARLEVLHRSGKAQLRELHAGGGYLAQSTTRLRFASPPSDPIVRARVRWPGGKRSELKIEPGQTELRLSSPR